MRGQYLEPITDDVKERFLDLIEAGHTRPEAAAAVDQSARVFRSMCNPASHRYDPGFAEAYAELTKKDGAFDNGMLERLEHAAFERAIRSSDRLLEKLLIIYSPEWKIHQPQAMQINLNIDEIRATFGELSDETLQQMMAELETKKMKQLEMPVIDVDAK